MVTICDKVLMIRSMAHVQAKTCWLGFDGRMWQSAGTGRDDIGTPVESLIGALKS
jgi:hypothetical protein